jgi:hypothetical protein
MFVFVFIVTEADSKLTSNPSPSENVLAALPIKENFERTRDGVSQQITAMEERLSRMKNASRVFNFAMRFLGNGSTVFKPFTSDINSDYVEFDFKTNNSRGGIVYVIISKTDLVSVYEKCYQHHKGIVSEKCPNCLEIVMYPCPCIKICISF